MNNNFIHKFGSSQNPIKKQNANAYIICLVSNHSNHNNYNNNIGNIIINVLI